MTRSEQMINSWCDYIMAEDRRKFMAVRITSPRLFNSDHLAIVAVLKANSKNDNKIYKKQRTSFPLTVQRGHANQAEQLQKRLIREAETVAAPNNRRSEWIETNTWALIDRRAQGRRDKTITGNELRRLNTQIRKNLRRDRKSRMERAAEDIQDALAHRDKQLAWDTLKRWYRLTTGRPPKPTRLDMNLLEQNIQLSTKQPHHPATRSPSTTAEMH
jgi:hypothetical protein